MLSNNMTQGHVLLTSTPSAPNTNIVARLLGLPRACAMLPSYDGYARNFTGNVSMLRRLGCLPTTAMPSLATSLSFYLPTVGLGQYSSAVAHSASRYVPNYTYAKRYE